ncbi:peptidoglycan editing factor PgeF [Limibacter armeniacum]|uniref:peptidoglycan editing factor PgeF n=1 Tax=Limibacter armeniacum TaxID=466084 RepID=UPI002FE5B96B
MHIKTFHNELPLYQFDNLSAIEGIQHFVSSRKGGVSKEHLDSLNLGTSKMVNDNLDYVMENRRRIADAINIAPTSLLFPAQTHSDHIKVVEATDTPIDDTDALITNKKGICIAVQSADCVPILLYDPIKKAAAAIHSGWRGTVQRIAEKTVQKMSMEFGTRPEDLIAGIGPSICQEIYEVGPEVVEEVEQKLGEFQSLIANRKDGGKAHLDLWEANRQMLINVGIKPKNIEVSGICSYTKHDEFFSARRGKTGRFGAGILLI